MKQIIKNFCWLILSEHNPIKILKDSFYRKLLNNPNFDLYIIGDEENDN